VSELDEVKRIKEELNKIITEKATELLKYGVKIQYIGVDYYKDITVGNQEGDVIHLVTKVRLEI